MTLREIQHLQAERSQAGFLSEPNKRSIGLCDKTSVAFPSYEEALADFQKHLEAGDIHYQMKSYFDPKDFDSLQKPTDDHSAETYDWSEKFYVMLQFFKPGITPKTIQAEKASVEALTALFAGE